MDSRNFFDVTGRSAPNKRNQFGFLLTGPVYIPKLYNGKDRTFFTFSWEWQRQRNGTTSTALVPTAQERAGDFSATAGAIVDPFTKVLPGQCDSVEPHHRGGPRAACAVPFEQRRPDATTSTPRPQVRFRCPFRIDHKLGNRDNYSGAQPSISRTMSGPARHLRRFS
jgi:hypothetical protein